MNIFQAMALVRGIGKPHQADPPPDPGDLNVYYDDDANVQYDDATNLVYES